MPEYIPTTQQIRDSYRSHDTLQAAAAGFSWEERGVEFDRWLAAHDHEVRDAALKEAIEAINAIEVNAGADYAFYESGLEEAADTIRALRSGTEGSGQ